MNVAASRTVVAEMEEMARKTEERGGLYGFLAMVYRREPSADLLGQIRDEEFLAALSDAGVALDEDVLEGADDMIVNDLAIEYTRLFIGPGKHIPPYESAQREGTLWGVSTSEVAAFIERCGFAYDAAYHSLPDHISVELEFMQELIRKEAVAWSCGDEAEARYCLCIQGAFLREHLVRWVPEFCAKVVEQTQVSFYKELATLTHDFIRCDEEYVARCIENGSRTTSDLNRVPLQTGAP